MRFLRILNPWMPRDSGETMEIPFEVARSSRKTMAMEVSADGRLIFRMPYRMPEQEAMRFAAQHERWIGTHYREAMEQKEQRPVFTDEEIHTYIDGLRPVLMHRVAYYAGRMGVDYKRITIRSQKTRWGSCSAKGNLNYNWKLMLCPEEVQDYVVVHELAHRREMNHSKAFYRIVEEILPDYRERMRWLKDHA